MRNYWVFWTYIANYSDKPIKVQAKSAKDAAAQVHSWYGPEFKEKAKVYIMALEPDTFQHGVQIDG